MRALGTGTLSSLVCLGLLACTGDQGPPGDPGAKGDPGQPGTPAPTTGVLTGTISDGVATAPLAGVAVSAKNGAGQALASATTDAAGKFSLTLDGGPISLDFSKDFYTSLGSAAVVFPGVTVDLTVVMNEAASGRPSVSLGAILNDVGYGASVALTASASDPNDDPVVFTWQNTTAPRLGALTSSGAAATVVMPTMAEAFAFRPDATNPGQFISGYTLEDRFGVVPILTDTRGQVTISVTVSDGRGQTATASRTLNAASVHGGTKDVAVGQRVYLNSGHPGPSSWTLTSAPAGSTAAFDDPASRTPSLVLDREGAYTVSEPGNPAPMTLYAKLWFGALSGGSGDSVTPSDQCLLCHGASFPGAARDIFASWLGTGHATMFTLGINGKVSDHYTGACFGCHTVGFDDGVANHGFDDVAGPWTMTAMTSTSWDNLVATRPEIARMANIQCESCHGPMGKTGSDGQLAIDEEAHTRTRFPAGDDRPFLSPRISYSSESCATCHAAGAHHLYSEWNTLGEAGMSHASRAGMTRGVSASGMNASCARCHVAQGYSLYADALGKGKIGLAALPVDPADPLKDPLKQVTLANAQPVTCVACHDPHDASNPNQLRFYGDTPMLPSGFSGHGMGKGALCLTCHNSRNGAQSGDATLTLTYLHEDGELYNAGNPTGYSAPHQADQGDVFLGHNAYFLGASMPMTSRHAAIEDTCAGCHMTLQPKGYLSHGAPTASGHLFRIEGADRQKLCSNCHGGAVDGEGIQGQVEAQLAALAAKMGNAVKAKINGFGAAGSPVRVRAWDEATDFYSSSSTTSQSNLVLDVSTNPVTSVDIEEIHGQIGFILHFGAPITVPFVDAANNPAPSKSLTSFGVQMGALKDSAATPVALYQFTATDAAKNPIPCTTCNMVRAGWNYFLIEGDQSKGLHNPSFVNAVLAATLAKDLSN